MGNSSLSHASELQAVMSIKRFRQDLDRNFDQMVEVESKIKRLNDSASGAALNTSNASAVASWKAKLLIINDSIESIKRLLAEGKRRIENKDRSDSSGMWIEFDAVMTKLEKELEDLPQMGVDVLPQSENVEWQREMRDSEGVFLPMVVAYADACRVELLLLEKYSEEELTRINEFISHKTPSDFSVEEAEEYELQYKSAVADFLHEFDHGKNLWDRFLDILAGGTHQMPSERVMLERWIVGEKGDL
ncbi:hypothetical protein SH449x_000221 [Pirellulaceae bacterium SH449]